MSHWQPDEFSQAEVDYSGGAAYLQTAKRKRSGKLTKAGKAAAMRRYRARHRSKCRDYMRRYMANRRLNGRAGLPLQP